MKEQIIIRISRSKICGLAAISRKNSNFNIIRRRLHPSITDLQFPPLDVSYRTLAC